MHYGGVAVDHSGRWTCVLLSFVCRDRGKAVSLRSWVGLFVSPGKCWINVNLWGFFVSISIFLGLFILCIFCLNVVHAQTCVFVYLVPMEVRRASDPLELELQISLNHYLGAGNWTCVLCKSNKCSSLCLCIPGWDYLCSPGCPGTCCVDQAGLCLGDCGIKRCVPQPALYILTIYKMTPFALLVLPSSSILMFSF